MDVSELLDGTEPIEVPLAGKTVKLYAYTAGWDVRATLDQLAPITPVQARSGELATQIEEIQAELKNEVPADRQFGLEEQLAQLREQHVRAAAKLASVVVPLAIESAEIDGEPFSYRGRSFHECAADLPASFLMSVMAKANDVVANPTKPDRLGNTSGAVEPSGIVQAESLPA